MQANKRGMYGMEMAKHVAENGDEFVTVRQMQLYQW